MARSRTVRLAHRARIEAPGSGYELRAVSVDPYDAALAVWTRRDDARHRVVRYAPGPAQAWDVPAGPPPDFVQALPGGRLLVAAGWSRDLPEPGRQALVLGSGGSPVANGELGNDVQHVLAGTDGAVWVGYGDEGVYGAVEGDPQDRVSAHGLARFDGGLRPSWAFPGDETDPIDDCYALTLTGGTAWAYYYSAFPIARIADGRVTAWDTGIEGAHALLVSPADGRAGLVGDYGHPSVATVGDLADGAFRPRATARLTLDGRDLAREDAHVITRGPTLHAFSGADWYVTGLDELA
jgi:hypothetical protein